MTKQISVILPVYNGGHLLKDAILSVLKQDLEDFEFLICDDCSTDRSFELIKELCVNKDHIKIFKNEINLGLFQTLNKLLDHCSAPLIHLWSQDDVMKPHCLTSTLFFHQKYPEIGMSYSGRDLIDDKGSLLSFYKKDETPELIHKERYALISCYWGCIAGNIANVTLVKAVLEKVGKFKEDMKVSGDFELWTRIAETSPIGFNRDANIFLRVHPGQLSNQHTSIVYRMKEDIPIMLSLLKMVSADAQKNALRCWRWKTQTMYFNEVVFLLRVKQWNLAKKGLKILSKISFLPLLSIRWALVKFFRLMNLEMWFFKKILHTLN